MISICTVRGLFWGDALCVVVTTSDVAALGRGCGSSVVLRW